MSTSSIITVGQFRIEVVRKVIKNMHLAVYPPSGRIRLAAPVNANPDVIRLFAISKLGWIKKHIKNFEGQRRETQREFISGESHFYKGKRYLLKITESNQQQQVAIKGTKFIEMRIRPNSTKGYREEIMKEWYRTELKKQLPHLIEKWETKMGVRCKNWGVKQMRTKWGSCTIASRRIWINLELAKKPKYCLEYIIVHELVHLKERHHNDRFISNMDKFMPKWRIYRDELSKLPVSHNEWDY